MLFAKLWNTSTANERPIDRQSLLKLINKLYASEKQQFDLTDFYQSFEMIGINSAFRSTERRFQFYDIPAYLNKGHRVVDICCNTGFLSSMLSFFVQEVYGFDRSTSLIQIAKIVAAFLNLQNVSFKVRHFEKMFVTGRYDAALALAAHGWVSMPFDAVADRIARLVKHDGWLFFESHNLLDSDKNIDEKIAKLETRGFSILREDNVPDFGDGVPRRFYVLKKR